MFSISVSNYRCFAAPVRATFDVCEGLTSFVGPNNSGKTTLLRLIYDLRDVWRNLSYNLPQNESPSGFPVPFRVRAGNVRPEYIMSNSNQEDLEIEIALWTTTAEQRAYPEVASTTVLSARIVVSRETGRALVRFPDLPEQPRNRFNVGHPEWALLMADARRPYPTEAYDFRPIRRVFERLGESFYIASGRNVLGVGGGPLYDLSVGTKLFEQWRDWRTGDDRQHNRTIRDVERRVRDFFSLDSLEINESSDLRSFQLVINGHPHQDDEVGSGMIQFIIVLANLAFARPEIILIDEPELNLHPRLQVEFVSAVASFAGTATLMATHSIGLARVAATAYGCSLGRGDQPRLRKLEATPQYADSDAQDLTHLDGLKLTHPVGAERLSSSRV